MSKQAKMRTVSNEDGESGRRVELQPNVYQDPIVAPQDVDHIRAEELYGLVRSKKDDELEKSFGIHPVQSNLIREIAEKKANGKPVHFSDGTKEMLWILHKRLKARGLLSSAS